MKRKCDNGHDAHIKPISDQDFKEQYQKKEKPVVRVDIGKNSCGICS